MVEGDEVSGTDKNTRMLALYHQLLTGKKINKQAFCVEQEINERSFDRDIEDVRVFLCEEQPYSELIYDRIDKKYYLSHTVGNVLSGEEALFLSNVLLAQKNVRSDELKGMLESLINITDSTRRDVLYKFMESKLKPSRKVRNNAVLKMHWDLERAILNCNQIELQYEIKDQDYVMRKVNPLELHIEGGYVYLIAYLVDKFYETPAYYRLDRIREFKIIKDKFSANIKEVYINKDIHSNRYSMLAGEEISVVVRTENSMKRVIEDLYPSHRVLESLNDKATYEIRTYKQGFISWLLGQGEKVEVIEPESFRQELLAKINEMQNIYKREGVE